MERPQARPANRVESTVTAYSFGGHRAKTPVATGFGSRFISILGLATPSARTAASRNNSAPLTTLASVPIHRLESSEPPVVPDFDGPADASTTTGHQPIAGLAVQPMQLAVEPRLDGKDSALQRNLQSTVPLAFSEATHSASEDDYADSLIDIDIPIPGVPHSDFENGPASTQLSDATLDDVADQTDILTADGNTVSFSFSDAEATSSDSGNVEEDHRRRPELVKRGKSLRVQSDAGRNGAASREPSALAALPSEPSSVLEASQPYSLDEDSATIANDNPNNLNQALSLSNPDTSIVQPAEAFPTPSGELELLAAQDAAEDSQVGAAQELELTLQQEIPNGLRASAVGVPTMVASLTGGAQSIGIAPGFELSQTNQATSAAATAENGTSAFATGSLIVESSSVASAAANSSDLNATGAQSQSPLLNQVFEGEMVFGEALSVGREDSAEIVINDLVREYSVEHPSICQLIRTGARNLTLVGVQEGSTRIAIVSSNAEGNPSVEIREVRVLSEVGPAVSLQDLAGEISQTIANLYPSSQLEVIAHGEVLIVQGIAESEQDARKILSLIRKTTLTPVNDRIRTLKR